MIREAVDPYGVKWYVRRVWIPRDPTWIGIPPRNRRRRKKRAQGPRRWGFLYWLTPFPYFGGWIGAGLALLALAAFVLAPILVFLLDAVLIGVVVLIGTVLRFVLGHPWIVEARTYDPFPDSRRWRVAGWSTSADAIEQIARTIEMTGDPHSLTLQ